MPPVLVLLILQLHSDKDPLSARLLMKVLKMLLAPNALWKGMFFGVGGVLYPSLSHSNHSVLRDLPKLLRTHYFPQSVFVNSCLFSVFPLRVWSNIHWCLWEGFQWLWVGIGWTHPSILCGITELIVIHYHGVPGLLSIFNPSLGKGKSSTQNT